MYAEQTHQDTQPIDPDAAIRLLSWLSARPAKSHAALPPSIH